MVRNMHDVGSKFDGQQSLPEDPTPQAKSTKRSRFIPVTQWENHHPWPPIGGLRHLIFFEKTNGFAHCILRIGRRVLIDEEKFFEWAGNQ